jgi:serine/threonine-protein kinase
MAAAPGRAPAEVPAPRLTTLGEYRLVKKLGAGGMGSVYLARQMSLDRDVALKVMSRELAGNPTFVQRFLREARIMARLDHPHIVRCYGAGEDHGWHYLAMEYVDGGSLASRLRKSDRLSVGDALHVLLACAEALQHAHEQHLVHRDMKPDNVLITRKGVVKVADLGLAKALDEDLAVTRTGVGAGTPIYMAPEQARDAKRVDHRCDIYALGCTLYRCLTGHPPFGGATTVELVEAKEKGKFPPARRSNPDVPERLDLILDKMLAPRPEQRYQSCAELIRDLKALGRANATLEFLRPQETAPQVERAPRSPAPPRHSPEHGTEPSRPLRLLATEPEENDIWYITYTTREGRVVTQKRTTGEVIALIRSPDFDPHMQASRTLNGGYRDVGTYREFQAIVVGRVARDTADRRTASFRSLYEKIDAEEKKRKKRRWIRDFVSGLTGWVAVLFWLGVLVIGAGLIFLIVRYGLHWLAGKLSAL